MTDVALDHNEQRLTSLPGWRSAAILLAAVAVAFTIAWMVPGGTDYPSSAVIPFAEWIGAVMQWLKVTFTMDMKLELQNADLNNPEVTAKVTGHYMFNIGTSLCDSVELKRLRRGSCWIASSNQARASRGIPASRQRWPSRSSLFASTKSRTTH